MRAAPALVLIVLLLGLAARSTDAAATYRKQVDAATAAHPRLRNMFSIPDKVTQGNSFDAEILGTTNASKALYAGQEVRVVVTTAFFGNTSARNDRKGPFANLESRYLSQKIFDWPYNRRNWTSFPAWNYTGPSNVRVRVISAYSTRSSRQGALRKCTDGQLHDVWAEFWGMSPRATAWGKGLAYSGFVTFAVPPFDFRICVKDVNPSNGTARGFNRDAGMNAEWKEFRNHRGSQRTYRSKPPLFLYSTAVDNQVGDFAAISVFPLTDGTNRPNDNRMFDPYAFSTHDLMKLVPAGLPCTYEKTSASATRRLGTAASAVHAQYCGANQVTAATGNFVDDQCAKEGATAESVPYIGSNHQNPLAVATAPWDYVVAGAFNAYGNATGNGTWLVGYTRFSATGLFDVCVSTRAYRRNALNASLTATIEGGYARNARPLWFKAYNANSSNCADVAHTSNRANFSACNPTTAAFAVGGAQPDVAWTMADRRASSWGELQFTAANALRPLYYTPASRWDHSTPRDYAYLDGGDQFRLVHESKFAAKANAVTDFGDLYTKSDGSRQTIEVVTAEASRTSVTTAIRNRIDAAATGQSLLTVGESSLTQFWMGRPGLGTTMAQAFPGCFYGGDDNYGRSTTSAAQGNPGAQCCTPAADGTCQQTGCCELSDGSGKGPRASANLGGAPRSGYSPWLLDGSGTSAYAYIRVPAGGRFRVCYRRKGGNWRVASATQGANSTFVVDSPATQVSYYLNDTAAGSWGQWRVTSTKADLTQQTWNYYTAPAAIAVGATLKVVLQSESCYLDAAQARGVSTRPGAAECLPDASSGTTCRGSQHTSVSAIASVYFYLKVPAYVKTTAYRICFRQQALNWVTLSASSFKAHLYMPTAATFHPLPPRSVAFFLDDRREDTLGIFRFVRQAGFEPTTPPLNAKAVGLRGDGDMVRLLPNVTGAGSAQLGCDNVFGTTVVDLTLARLQSYNASRSATNLGVFCNESTTSSCSAAALTPTTGGLSGAYPYTALNFAANDRILGPYDGTVASIQVPPRVSGAAGQAYKVCYKQAGRNWLEAVDNATGSTYFTPARPPTHYLSAMSTPLVAGAYAWFDITATSAVDAVSWSTALVKLVDFSAACTAPPLGASSALNTYTASAGFASPNQRGGGYVVDASSASQIRTSAGTSGTSTVVRAFIPLPTLNSSTSATSTYRLCFMHRRPTDGSLMRNWHDLKTPIVVSHLGITFTVEEPPVQYSPFRVRFLSRSRSFQTAPAGDAAKVVLITQPCTTNASFVMPSVIDSSHIGREASTTEVNGTTDLGPSTSLRRRTRRRTSRSRSRCMSRCASSRSACRGWRWSKRVSCRGVCTPCRPPRSASRLLKRRT
jgi:hypothetical protein